MVRYGRPSFGVQFGYPLTFDFLPDLETFYERFLGEPLGDSQEPIGQTTA